MEAIQAIVLVDDPHAEGVQAAAWQQAMWSCISQANNNGLSLTGEHEFTLYVDEDGSIFGEAGAHGYVLTVEAKPIALEQMQEWMNQRGGGGEKTLGQSLTEALHAHGIKGDFLSLVANAEETAVTRVIQDEDGHAALNEDGTIATAVEVFDTRL
jgi:hypothetical protein